MATRNEKVNQRLIEHLIRVAFASLLMMWGVVNLVFNFLSFRRLEAVPEALPMTLGVLLVFVTGLVPFVIGFLWLWKLMGNRVSQAGRS